MAPQVPNNTNFDRKIGLVVAKSGIPADGGIITNGFPTNWSNNADPQSDKFFTTPPQINTGQLPGDGGFANGRDLSDMRIQFKVNAPDFESYGLPMAVIRVFNLKDATADEVLKEYDQVVLQAGYSNGNFGVIFNGTIRQYRRGRLSATDTFVDIIAADTDYWYTWAFTKDNLKSGWKQEDAFAHIANGSNGQIKGELNALGSVESSGVPFPRGKTFFGLARHYSKVIADSTNTTFIVDNGTVKFVTRNGVAPGTAIVLNSATGLVGTPTAETDGIHARCLLNPNIKPTQEIQINNAALNKSGKNDAIVSTLVKHQLIQPQFFAKVYNDGFYRVMVVEHSGDTRGLDWYSDLICLRLDKSSGTTTAHNQ